MIYSHNTTIDFCGEEYDAEVDFEFCGESYPLIYSVEIVKQTCKKGGFFYTDNGSFQSGPAYVRVNVTDLLSAEQIGIFANEIIAAEAAMRTDFEIDQAEATKKAVLHWTFCKENGLDANYTPDMREAA